MERRRRRRLQKKRWQRAFGGWRQVGVHPKSISKSLLNEVGILENLAKQKNLVSNSLGNNVGIFRDLAFLPSMRAYARAYSAAHRGIGRRP